jgi:hypothetical protein
MLSLSTSKGSVMAIAEETGYTKVYAHLVSQMLMAVHTDTRKATATDLLHHHGTRSEGFLLQNVIGTETCVHHINPNPCSN